MDKLFHFKPKNPQPNNNLKHLTQDQAGFYSEEETESPTLK